MNLNFNERYSICTALGFISDFRVVQSKGRKGYTYELDWDPDRKTYFSQEDARKVQKSLRSKAAINDESQFVEQLARDFYAGLCSLQQVYSQYTTCSLAA